MWCLLIHVYLQGRTHSWLIMRPPVTPFTRLLKPTSVKRPAHGCFEAKSGFGAFTSVHPIMASEELSISLPHFATRHTDFIEVRHGLRSQEDSLFSSLSQYGMGRTGQVLTQ